MLPIPLVPMTAPHTPTVPHARHALAPTYLLHPDGPFDLAAVSIVVPLDRVVRHLRLNATGAVVAVRPFRLGGHATAGGLWGIRCELVGEPGRDGRLGAVAEAVADVPAGQEQGR